MKTNPTLSERELIFCRHYVRTRTPREAALAAGYPSLFAKRRAAFLLDNPLIGQEILRLEREERDKASLKEQLIAGLVRASLGDISDAVRLLAMTDEELLSTAESLDLFCISEIKRPKGGGIELKFLDRIKALNALKELCEEEGGLTDESGFLSALEACAGGFRS